jgi:hypothetical protein
MPPSAGGHRAPQRPRMNDLHLNDRVRLREAYLGLPPGAVGVVIGFYRREPPACAVRFEHEVREVPVDRLEPAGDDK